MKDQNNFTKRSNIDIMYSILVIAKDGESKTHIMYKCNLSYKQFKEYVRLLLDLGFLEKQSSGGNNRQTLKSTYNGIEFLRKYAELKGLINLGFAGD